MLTNKGNISQQYLEAKVSTSELNNKESNFPVVVSPDFTKRHNPAESMINANSFRKAKEMDKFVNLSSSSKKEKISMAVDYGQQKHAKP